MYIFLLVNAIPVRCIFLNVMNLLWPMIFINGHAAIWNWLVCRNGLGLMARGRGLFKKKKTCIAKGHPTVIIAAYRYNRKKNHKQDKKCLPEASFWKLASSSSMFRLH